MDDSSKSKKELIKELDALRKQLASISTNPPPNQSAIPILNGPLIEGMIEGFQIIDFEWRYIYLNNTAAIHAKKNIEELLGNRMMDVYPGIENTKMFQSLKICMEHRNPINMENQFTYPDGSKGWFELRVQPVPEGILVLSYDISEKKENERKLTTLLSNLPGIAYRCKNQKGWPMLFLSQGCENLTGYPPETFVNNPDASFEEVVHPDDRNMVWDTIQQAVDAGEPYTLEYRIITRDQKVKWVWEQGVSVGTDQDGNEYLEGFITDLSERKRAQEALRDSEAKFRTLVEKMPAITYIAALDDNSTTLYISPQIEKLLGFSAEEYRTNPDIWSEQLHPDDRERVLIELNQSHNNNSSFISEYRMFSQDGREKWFRDEAQIVEDENSTPKFLQGLMLDITKRKLAEEELNLYIDRIESLLEIENAITSTLDLDKVLEIIMNQFKKIIPYESISLQLLKKESLEVIACNGFIDNSLVVGLQVPLDPGLPFYKIISTMKPFSIKDIDQEYHTINDNLKEFRAEPIRSFLGVPLISKGTLIGLITLDRSTVNEFSESEIQMAIAIASHAALAIENARLYRETNLHLERISSLRQIDRAISSSMDLRLTMDVILEQVTSRLDVDATDILLFNPTLNLLEFAAGKGFRNNKIINSKLRLGEGYSGKAALNRNTIFIPELLEAEPSFMRASFIASENFISFFAVPLIAKGQIQGVLEVYHRNRLSPEPEWIDFLETLAGQAAIAIDNARLLEGMQSSKMELEIAYDATIEGWSIAMDLRDNETEGHSLRVTEQSVKLAKMMGIKDEQIIHMRRGALLHDMGKLGVPDEILYKPGKLTEEEWDIMRQHPQYANDMLCKIDYLNPALDIPYSHHEKWDGTGYPQGLKGERIPLPARIFSVIDVWDALRSDRPYRKAWSESETIKYIEEQSGKHFDPEIVKVFLKNIDEFK